MRFVIHEHQKHGDPLHWDLMLEYGETLKTFRLDCAPHHVANEPCQATPIFDHDIRFLTYEGPVQQGLGQVKRVDSGTYKSIHMTQHTWTVDLKGEVLAACVRLPLVREDSLAIVDN
jgi:hypothetical protein